MAINFDEQERDTGTKWLDGRTVWQKTVRCLPLPSAATNAFIAGQHGIDNIGTVVRMTGTAASPNNFFPLTYVAQALSTTIGLHLTATDIIIPVGTNRSEFTEVFVTLLYTRTDRP